MPARSPADVELAYYTRMATAAAAAAAGHESSIFFSTFFARDFSPDIICQRVASSSSSPSNSASVVEAFAKRNSARKIEDNIFCTLTGADLRSLHPNDVKFPLVVMREF